jgi:prepilin-type N-terminal cleavage/methylation domain-containing protein
MSTMHQQKLRRSRRGLMGLRRAFTLIEVMISVALVLLLMYGVSQVFKLSGDAVSANQAVSSIVRDHRATAATMAEDFRNCVQDSPLFLISSRIAYNGPASGAGAAPKDKVNGVDVSRGFAAGFRTAEEQRNNGDPDPTTFDKQSHSFMQVLGSDRVPRLDRLGFFVRNRYRRLMFTPSGTSTPPPMTSTEAYVWYGHTAYPEPNNPGLWTSYSGVTMNLPENQFAADRILGRVAVLMKHALPISSSDPNRPYFPKNPPPTNPSGDQFMWPFNYSDFGFAFGSPSALPPTSDVAPVSIEDFRASVDTTYSASPTNFTGPRNWYVPMEDFIDLATVSNSRITRFFCTPTVSRPIDEKKLAMTVPYFLGHCTQFVVEYAGDFLEQAEYDPSPTTKDRPPGAVTDVGKYVDSSDNSWTIYNGKTDGKIDYVVDTSADPNDPPSDPTKWVRRIRWYGLPRDVNGDGNITINDVVPLGDVMTYYWKGKTGQPKKPGTFDPASTGGPVLGGSPIAPWEKVLPLPLEDSSLLDKANPALPVRTHEDYAQQNYAKYMGSASAFQQICAWRNDAPLMIRVLVKIDDPTGKLQDGQWYEYVFSR